MDTSYHRGRRPAPVALPEIYVHDPSERFRYPSRSSSYDSSSAASPREISMPDAREAPPPPLPPPRYLADVADYGHNGQDIAWKWGNLHDDSRDRGRSTPSITPGSSLNGGHFVRRIMVEQRPEFARSAGSNSTVRATEQREISYHRDEGYARVGTSTWSNKSRSQESSSPLPSFSNFESSVHAKYQSNAQAFDKSQLQKLDARRGSGHRTPPPKAFSNPSFSSSVNDFSSTSRSNYTQRHSSQLKPLSLPPTLPGRPGLVESPLSRCVETPPSSAISPKNPYTIFGMQNQFDRRPPSEVADYPDRSPVPYTGRSGSTSDDVSSVTSRSRDTYDVRVSPENDDGFLTEENGFRRLHIEDLASRLEGYSPTSPIGRKRRASSPLGEEGSSLHPVGSASDLYRRRESASRASPTPRLHSTSGSVSSTASAPRNGSYASSLSVTGSSVTSMSSYGRLSPGGISPGGLSAAGSDMSDSPYVTSLLLNPSPRRSISRTNHHRALSEMKPLMNSRKLTQSLDRSNHHSPKKQLVFMCDCCPKKPKKFNTPDELIAHEQEKQYECAYCRNRFKNKNEAERHQNSLHLRRHSWSCAALSCYEAAFHSSPNKPNEADTCGYCGEDFLRSGISSPSMPGPPRAVATERDWKARANHLQEVHKFGECNHAKKFFRADHFRQHLKHSHAGTSGKWTNVLENSCMKDEPLPEPIRGHGRASPVGARVGRINEEDEIP